MTVGVSQVTINICVSGKPDRELQSRDRIWKILQPDLQVDSRGVANYKGRGFEVRGKGLCRSPSLTNAVIE